MASLHNSNSENHSMIKNQSSDSVTISDNSSETQQNRELFLRYLLENLESDSEE
ncbi:hypothetical protein [Pedobacter aquatilis]|uniref:hypothetical protein n=1 Tax=Pedobacter aquatilis TaxID=351343 RepID=UPI002931E8F3|nr:hypothetical protein [Pedobacter aquatilis]